LHPTAFVFMRADPSLDANQNRKVVMSITARSIAVKDIGREATIFIRGDAMDRDEYLRRASALEKRAADFVYPGLRTALLNTAAQYRNRANQTVVSRADAKFLSNEHPRGPRVPFGSPDYP
jgi:hypothetical protein